MRQKLYELLNNINDNNLLINQLYAQVIRCLKDVSRRHNIGVVTSIHQPNNDVLMLFDKLYVLAKGGLCLYDGSPQCLREHLNEADIDINEYQVPIEVLLKIGSKYDERVRELVDLTLKQRNDLRHRCITEGRLSPKGIPKKSLNFDLTRMWYLFQRTTAYSFQSQWKAMVIQFIFILSLGFVITQLYNKHIGEADGCFSFEQKNTTTTCFKSMETLKEESYLSQNLRFVFFSGILIQFLTTVATTLIFTTEVRIFLNEHKNGMNFIVFIQQMFSRLTHNKKNTKHLFNIQLMRG